MRFIGSKAGLLDFIECAVHAAGARNGVFCDLFAGTTLVGRRFKRLGYSVASNDLMRLSAVLGRAYLEINAPPPFNGLFEPRDPRVPRERLHHVLEALNALPPRRGFFWRHYSPEGTAGLERPRKYFSAENAGRIDAIRARIARWRDQGRVTDAEHHLLLAALLEAVPGVSNIAGTYGAFLKRWDPRALKPLRLVAPEILPSAREHRVYTEDAETLAARLSADVLYLDPPYNTRQYLPNYHILETLARGDDPHVTGVTGLRYCAAERSRFCRRDTALAGLDAIARNADCGLLVLSYNSEGLMPDDAIRDVLRLRGRVTVLEHPYRRFRSHARSAPKPVIERLYCVSSRGITGAAL